MLRSMFSAVSGLRSHQTMMDVTGNNVSNVNTAGFKSQRTTFQETLTQLLRGGTGGAAGQGGQNPMQIGLGSQVGATDIVFTQGGTQTTGRATDVAIQGDGFFMVSAGGENVFMRAGSFAFDSAGNLVGPGGEVARGWIVDLDDDLDPNDDLLVNGDPLDPAQNAPDLIQLGNDPANDFSEFSDISIRADGKVVGRDNDGNVKLLAQLAMARFANPGGLENLGSGRFSATGNEGVMTVDLAGNAGIGTLQSGALEMSNVDLAQEFTNLILAQRGYQANARTITSSDELLQELVNLKR